MTYEELFDAYRQAMSEREMLVAAGDLMWHRLRDDPRERVSTLNWEVLRGIGGTPPVEDWAEC